MSTGELAVAAPTSEPAFFWIACTYDGGGTLRDAGGEVLLNFAPSGRLTTFSDPTSKEVFVIRRQGIAPFSRWLLFAADVLLCTIRRRGLWRSKYTLAFTDGQRWTVRFPLFTIWCTCTSEQGEQLRLQLVQHTAWCLERLPANMTLSFLAGLAVIQRERQWA